MGKFVERKIEPSSINTEVVFFLHGDDPKPKVLIDDVNKCMYYTSGMITARGELIYLRKKYLELNGELNN